MIFVNVLDTLFEVYIWILIGRFLLTWIPNLDYYHPVVRFVIKITDPIVQPFRGIIPAMGNIDFTPMVLLIVLRILYPLLRTLLLSLVFRLG